jgi:hypothetical protein
MNHRRWLWVILVGALGVGLPEPASARQTSLLERLFKPKEEPAQANPSHRPLWNDSGSLDQMETLLANHMARSKDRRNADEEARLKEMVQKFLDNPELVEKLTKSLDKETLQRLQSKIENDKDLTTDPALPRLLQQAQQAQKDLKLSPEQAELIQNLAGRLPDPDRIQLPASMQGPANSGNPQQQQQPPIPPDALPQNQPNRPSVSPPPTPPSGPSWTQKITDQSSDWFKDHAADWLESLNDLGQPGNEAWWRDALNHLGEGGGLDLDKHFPSLGKYLPVDEMKGEIGSLLPKMRLPGPGSLGGLPSAGPSGGDGLVRAVVVLVVCACFGVLIWKSMGLYRQRTGPGRSWRLGPWPVHPAEVSTREHVVQAYEYLALLCLGRAARAYHHLGVAERLAAIHDVFPGRRREAANRLAWLYEQARYAPPSQTLAPEDLEAARHDLCLLAGVAGP